MKRFIFLLALLGTLGPSFSQETFFNYVEGWKNVYTTESDSGYTLYGLDNSMGPGNHELKFNSLSFQGITLSDYSFSIDTAFSTGFSNGAHLFQHIGEDLLILGYLGVVGGNNEYKGTLMSYDSSEGETDILNVYEEEEFVQLLCSDKIGNDNLLIAGYTSDNEGTSSLKAFHTDVLGNIDWTFSTGCGFNCRIFPKQILSLSNGNIALLFREIDFSPGSLYAREQAVLVMLTGDGEELWRVYPGEEDTHRIVPGGMIERDGELLVAYTDPYYYDEDDGQWFANYEGTIYFDIYSLDSTLQGGFSLEGLIPNGTSGTPTGLFHQVNQLVEMEDGTIMFSGHTGFHGFIGKLDPDMNFLWYRLHAPHTVEDNFVFQYTHIYHTLPTSDGGFLCTGQYQSNPSELYPQGIQTAIALKLDEYGCLEPGCQLVDEIPEHEQGSLQVWPNPASSDLNVRLPEGVQAEKMILLDALGRIQELRSGNHGTAHLQVSLSSLHLPSGLYTLILTSRDGKVFSEKLILE